MGGKRFLTVDVDDRGSRALDRQNERRIPIGPFARPGGPGDAERVTQPVLNVLGARSAPRFVEGSDLIQSWFPRAQRLSVPDAGHLLMVQNPAGLARGLRGFFTPQGPSAPPTSPAAAAVSVARGRSGTS